MGCGMDCIRSRSPSLGRTGIFSRVRLRLELSIEKGTGLAAKNGSRPTRYRQGSCYGPNCGRSRDRIMTVGFLGCF